MTSLLEKPKARVESGPHHQPPPTGTEVRKFRPDIEGLRAIAVTLVVLYHAGVPFLPGGYVGVDVFFVISGFLITTHLLGEITRTGGVSLAKFYGRRARRLLPLATTVLVATMVAVWTLLSGLQAAQVGVQALWTAGFAMNIHLASTGVDYQANQDPSPLQHYWSLAVEEQFYIVWPLMLMLLTVMAARWFGEVGRRRLVAGVVGVGLVASFLYCIWLTNNSPTEAYFSTPNRAWELLLGAVVAVGAKSLVNAKWLQSSAVSLLGLGLLAYAALTFTEDTPFPGYWAAVPAVGTALVICAGLSRATGPEQLFLGIRPIQAIGRLSYGWYLWHWPVLIIAAAYLERGLTLTEGLILAGVGLWLAGMSYIAIEDPLRSYPSLVKSARNSLLSGGIAIAISVVVAVAAIVVAPMNLTGTGAAVAAVSSENLLIEVESATTVQALPANLTPSLDVAADDKPNLNSADGISCMVGLLTADISSEPGGTCVAGGTENGDITVVVTGDSHAYHWVPALTIIAKERGWRLVSMTKSGCTLYDVALVNTQLDRDYTECYDWREKVFERIAVEKPAMIITSAAIFSERAGDFSQRWTAGVSSTTERLVGTGAKVVTIEDTPYPKRDIPKCLAQNPSEITQCTLPVTEAMSDNARRVATAQAAAAAGSETINPISWFCGTKTCPVVVGNVLMYTDNSHMSSTYSKQLAPLLGAELPTL